MGQKDGEKWTAAVDLQPTIPKSDRLLGSSCLLLPRDSVRDRLPTRFGDEYPGPAGRLQSLVSLIWAPGNIDDSKPAHLQLEFIVGQHETNAFVMGQVFSNAVGSAA